MSDATEQLPDDLVSALALLAQERDRRVAAEAEAAKAMAGAFMLPQSWVGHPRHISISGRRPAKVATALLKRQGKPRMIVSDNGTELAANAILARSKEPSRNTSRREDQCKTAMSRVPTAEFATSWSTTACSSVLTVPQRRCEVDQRL